MKKETQIPSLTGILLEDKKGGYTAWLKEFPGVVAEGDTENEAQANLVSALMGLLSITFKTIDEDKIKSYEADSSR